MTIKPTSEQINTLQKLFNTGVERANTMLNYLTEWPLHLQMSAIEILSSQQLQAKLEQRVNTEYVAAMELAVRGEFEAVAQLIFPADSAATLVEVLADPDRRNLDQDTLKMKTLSEVGNIFFNGLMGSLSNVINGGITYMAPTYKENTVKHLLASSDSNIKAVAILGRIQFKIEQIQVKGEIILFLKIYPFENLLEDITQNK
jgi:chemotaxis protein CheC